MGIDLRVSHPYPGMVARLGMSSASTEACLGLRLREALLDDLVGGERLLRPGGREVLPRSRERHPRVPPLA